MTFNVELWLPGYLADWLSDQGAAANVSLMFISRWKKEARIGQKLLTTTTAIGRSEWNGIEAAVISDPFHTHTFR